MMDPEHMAIFKLLDRIDSKLDKTDEKINGISINCSTRYETCSTCRIDDKKELNQEINKKTGWDIMSWIMGGIFISLAFLLLFSIETRNSVGELKTELSVHTGKIIKNYEILPHDLGLSGEETK